MQEQFIVLPLRHSVQVFSGIKPPDELLRRPRSPPKTAPRPDHPAPRPTTQAPVPAPARRRQRPAPAYRPPVEDQARCRTYVQRPAAELPEDAMADNILPVGGPRAGYRPPMAGDQGMLFASANREVVGHLASDGSERSVGCSSKLSPEEGFDAKVVGRDAVRCPMLLVGGNQTGVSRWLLVRKIAVGDQASLIVNHHGLGGRPFEVWTRSVTAFHELLNMTAFS